jgi:hypothetical protein
VQDWQLCREGDAPIRKLAQHRSPNTATAPSSPPASTKPRRSVRDERLASEQFLRNSFSYDAPIPEIPPRQIEPLPPPLDEIFTTQQTPIATALPRAPLHAAEITRPPRLPLLRISRRLHAEEAAMRDRKT